MNDEEADADSRNEVKSTKLVQSIGLAGGAGNMGRTMVGNLKPKACNDGGGGVANNEITPVSGVLAPNFGSFEIKE